MSAAALLPFLPQLTAVLLAVCVTATQSAIGMRSEMMDMYCTQPHCHGLPQRTCGENDENPQLRDVCADGFLEDNGQQQQPRCVRAANCSQAPSKSASDVEKCGEDANLFYRAWSLPHMRSCEHSKLYVSETRHYMSEGAGVLTCICMNGRVLLREGGGGGRQCVYPHECKERLRGASAAAAGGRRVTEASTTPVSAGGAAAKEGGGEALTVKSVGVPHAEGLRKEINADDDDGASNASSPTRQLVFTTVHTVERVTDAHKRTTAEAASAADAALANVAVTDAVDKAPGGHPTERGTTRAPATHARRIRWCIVGTVACVASALLAGALFFALRVCQQRRRQRLRAAAGDDADASSCDYAELRDVVPFAGKAMRKGLINL